MSEFIGLVIAKETKELRMVVNPDHDEQLNDPCWLASSDDTFMIKVARRYSELFNQNTMTASGVAYIQTNLEKFLETE